MALEHVQTMGAQLDEKGCGWMDVMGCLEREKMKSIIILHMKRSKFEYNTTQHNNKKKFALFWFVYL